MWRARKTIIAPAVALALVVAACGGDDDDADTDDTDDTTDIDTGDDTDDTEADDAGADEDTDSGDADTDDGDDTDADDSDDTDSDDADSDDTDSDDTDSDDVVTAVVGLSVLAPAPALELTAHGAKDALAECAAVGIEVVERNAEGDIPSLTAIVEGFVGDDVDAIVTVTTPAAQAAYQVVGAAGGTIPVFFSTVTDPFAAGLAEDPSTHEPWITGNQALPPFDDVIDVAQEVVPGLAVMGMVYNPSESNAQAVVDALQPIADERGLVLELTTITDSAEVGQATEALLGRDIDAFIVPTDTTMVTGMAAMVQIAEDNQIPVIGTDANHAVTGAAIGVGTDYYGSGFGAGEMACEVLSGNATPADFDVLPVPTLGVAVNLAAAEAQGVTIPDELLDDAEVVG